MQAQKEIIIPYKPHSCQLEFHNSKARFRVLACGRRWGKSIAAVNESVRFAATKPKSVIWIVAPVYAQSMILWRMFREYLPWEITMQYKNSERCIELKNDSAIWCKSADNYDNLRGEGLDFLIVDEAALVRREAWEHVLRPALVDKQGTTVFISTPKGRNWFWEMFARGQDREQEDYVSWRYPSSSNPYLSAEEIAEARRTLPDRVFRQEFLAEFISDVGGVFRNVRNCVTGNLEEPKQEESYIIGVDLAKYQDFTVLCTLDSQGHLVHFDRFSQLDWNLQKQRIALATQKYKAQIIIDSTGVGDPIFEDLVKAGLNVRGYSFTQASKKALIDNLALRIEQRQITFPEIPELINELEIYEYELTQAGNLRFNAPQGYHADCVIALALATMGMSKGAEYKIIGELGDYDF